MGFDQCYDRELPLLVRFLLRQGADLHEAIGAAQLAFGRASRRWDEIGDPRVWLRHAAYREFVNRLPDDLADVDGPLPPDTALTVGEHTRAVVRLPYRRRRISSWHLDGFSDAEVAAELRLTEKSVNAVTSTAPNVDDNTLIDTLRKVLDLDAGRAALLSPDDTASPEFSAESVALNLIARVSPDELPMFAESLTPIAPHGRSGPKELRFGVTEVVALVTPVAMIAANQIVGYLAQEGAKTGLNRLRRLIRNQRGPAEHHDSSPLLTEEQAERVRRIILEVARESSMSEDAAEDLAEAAVDALNDVDE